jgi:hypothetical protein
MHHMKALFGDTRFLINFGDLKWNNVEYVEVARLNSVALLKIDP